MKTMLGGSLKISHLSEEVETLLRSAMKQGDHFVVGDAPGADALFQKILKESGFVNVEVFFSGAKPRFNLGAWRSVHIDSGLRGKGHAMHGAKDRKMVEDSGKGLFAWDGISVGTVANAMDLFGQGKPFALVAQERSGALIINDLMTLSSRSPSIFNQAEKRLAAATRRAAKRNREAGESSPTTLF